MRFKTLRVLGIPDDYKYMEPELAEKITSEVSFLLLDPFPIKLTVQRLRR